MVDVRAPCANASTILRTRRTPTVVFDRQVRHASGLEAGQLGVQRERHETGTVVLLLLVVVVLMLLAEVVAVAVLLLVLMLQLLVVFLLVSLVVVLLFLLLVLVLVPVLGPAGCVCWSPWCGC